MEDNINNTVEFEETNNVPEEIEESCDCGTDNGGVVAGIVGGIIAYVVIDGAKRLWRFVAEKRAEKKQPKEVPVTTEAKDAAEPEAEQQ